MIRYPSLPPPAHDPKNILDVGTGTGIWAIDMADQYPSAVVTGVDLSPTQPAFVPPNCVFEVDDVTEQWTYTPKHFDFVHVRDMFGSVPDWDAFLREVYRCTKPGGWVEMAERGMDTLADDDTLPPDHFYFKFTAEIFDAAAKMGKSFDIWKEAKDRMIAAGFVDVVEVPFKWPVNSWPDDPAEKMLGRFNQFRLNEGCEGFMLRALTMVSGVSFLTVRLSYVGG
jgi:SAM-dependent methyltransferase